MSTYRIWPSTNGPSSPSVYSGNFISGTVFCVTGEAWFQGYWWWVCPTGQSTSAVKCALWQWDSGGNPRLVTGSVVTSGALTAGQWNYIPIATPLALSLGGSTGMSPTIKGGADGSGIAAYVAAIGVNGSFPDTNNYWGTGQTAPNGITNGPLTAYSAHSASMPSYNSQPQGCFSVAGNDPSTQFPNAQSNTDNFWVDVQVCDYSNVAATMPSIRLWPNFPYPSASGSKGDNGAAVSATAFTLSQACKLDKIWVFSPTSAGGLNTRTGIWNTDTQTIVSGTDNTSPSWKTPAGGSASAGTGWMYVDYSASGVTLPAGNYAVSFFNGSGATTYYDSDNVFFAGIDPVSSVTVGGAAWNGISSGGGILTAPNVANGPELTYDDGSGTKRGNGMYTGPTSHVATTTWVYPIGFESSADWGESRWADVEVTPLLTVGSGALMASGIV